MAEVVIASYSPQGKHLNLNTISRTIGGRRKIICDPGAHPGAYERIQTGEFGHFKTRREALQKSNSASLRKDKEKSAFYYEFEAQLLSRIGSEIAGLEKETFLRNLLLRLSRDPKLPNLWFSLGLMLSDAEMYASANEAYNMVIKLNPAHKKLWNAKGLALSRLGRNDEATVCYQRSLKCYEDASATDRLDEETDPVIEWFAQRKREDAAARKLIFRLRSLEEQAKKIINN